MPNLFPRDLVAELFLADGWRDVFADVRQTVPVTITSGQLPEADKPQSTTVTLTLLNPDGAYSPRNPTGQWYGSIGRGTPLRLAIRAAKDPFDEPVTGGWGTMPTGHVWDTTVGSGGTVQASDWNVAGGLATHSIPVANAERVSKIPAWPYRNSDQAVSFSSNTGSNITGGALYPATLRARCQSDTEFYSALVIADTAENLTIGLYHVNGGGQTTIVGQVNTGYDLLAGTQFRVRFQVEGQTLRAKLWPTTGPEPYDWHCVGRSAAIDAAGYNAVRTFVEPGNSNTKPVIISYDDYEIRLPQAASELTKLPQKWSLGEHDRYVPVKAGGIIRRLGQGQSALPSSPRRHYPTTSSLIAYWPLDDGSLASSGKAAVGSQPMLYFSTISPSKNFGKGELGSWLPNGVALTGESMSLFGLVDLGSWASSTGWAIEHTRRGGLTNDSIFVAYNDPDKYEVRFLPTTQEIRVVGQGTDVTTSVPSVFDGGTHVIRFTVAETVPGTCTWRLYVDGVQVAVALPTGALNRLIAVGLVDATPHSDALAVGHVAVFKQTGAGNANTVSAVMGWPGETAVARAVRLASENGVQLDYVGEAAASALMGPQGTAPLLDLLVECVVADGGLLYEAKGSAALVYKTRSSLYSQTARVTLSYSVGQISPSLEPIDDDLRAPNVVTVKRQDGGEVTVARTTGRLSTQPPPVGIGVSDGGSVIANLASDTPLQEMAEWLLHLGTVDEERYQTVVAELRSPDITDLLAEALMDLYPGDRVVLDDMASVNVYDPVNQLITGTTVTLNTAFLHSVAMSCTPESPYHVLTLDDADLGRLDSDTTTLNEDLTTTETGVDILVSDGTFWSTTDIPYDWVIGGERVTVTAMGAPSGSVQTATVTRSANGVVKAHSAGVQVQLADPIYLGRG